MISFKRTACWVAAFVVSFPALAWREGNGGDGIRMNSRLYLLDLVEAGVESPAADTMTRFQDPYFEAQVARWAENQPVPVPREEILNKLGDIYRKNNLFAHVLLMAMQKLDWTWVNAPLKEVADSGQTVVGNPELVQLAVRINQVVHIQAGLWKELDARHQAALIFHEALFAMVHPERLPNGLSMSSPRVRRITGFLFSKKLQTASLDEVLKVEAPEFRYISLSARPLKVYQSSANSEWTLFNAHWSLQAQDPSGATLIFKESGLSESDPDSSARLCSFAREKKASVQVSFTASQLQIGLKTLAQGTHEDFYLVHSFQPESHLSSLLVEGDLNGDSCHLQINQMKKILLREVTQMIERGTP